MTAAPVLEPAAPGADAFVDALVGLDRLCGWLAPVIDAALVDGEAGDPPGGADASDDLLDALLGLVSLETTLSLVLAAIARDPGEPAEAGDGPTAGWSREVLR